MVPPIVAYIYLYYLLELAAAISYAAVVYFAIKLYNETDKGWYWLFLVLAAFIFAIPHWTSIFLPLKFDLRFFSNLFGDVAQLIGGILFGLACYGMYTTMHKIRKRVE